MSTPPRPQWASCLPDVFGHTLPTAHHETQARLDAEWRAFEERFAAPEWRGLRAFVQLARAATELAEVVVVPGAQAVITCSVTNTPTAEYFVFRRGAEEFPRVAFNPYLIGLAGAATLLELWPQCVHDVAKARAEGGSMVYQHVRFAQLDNAVDFIRCIEPAPSRRTGNPFVLEYGVAPPYTFARPGACWSRTTSRTKSDMA